eukprot:TRINITY_DN7003_c0_g1_i1.p1 TRINITY_DN7003_c0_g1~~TRINITY_DN7003_c0_g1_i1.p1  ORF type:complete len:393 (-),score=33.80 TRINITY_DN7003_c0_g1_i1:8-1186(-)
MHMAKGTFCCGAERLMLLLLALVACFIMGAMCAEQMQSLTLVAQSNEKVWNAVAVVGDRIFVAGPRWLGNGSAVEVMTMNGSAVINASEALPYPDARWNAWSRGVNPARSFVDVNAIHLDPLGLLWIVDTGAPDFGGQVLPNAPKLVCVDVESDTVVRVIPVPLSYLHSNSYIDDVRFHGEYIYATDAGFPGLLVIERSTGKMRRVLDGSPWATARANRPIRMADGHIVRGPDGKPLMVNSDPLEVSSDGQWLLFGPLAGPWARVPTSCLDNFSCNPGNFIEKWRDLPPVGGTALDASPNGYFYYSDLARNAFCYFPELNGSTSKASDLVRDSRLHWVDAPFLEPVSRQMYLAVPQIDRAAVFNGNRSLVQWPVQLFRVPLPNWRPCRSGNK